MQKWFARVLAVATFVRGQTPAVARELLAAWGKLGAIERVRAFLSDAEETSFRNDLALLDGPRHLRHTKSARKLLGGNKTKPTRKQRRQGSARTRAAREKEINKRREEKKRKAQAVYTE